EDPHRSDIRAVVPYQRDVRVDYVGRRHPHASGWNHTQGDYRAMEHRFLPRFQASACVSVPPRHLCRVREEESASMSDENAARPTGSEQRVSGYAWYALILFVVVYVFNFIDRQIVSILAESIKADLKLDDAQIGFLYGTAFAVFYALFGIPLGRLADSWYRGRLMAIGLALWSSMTAASGFAQSFGMLAAARIGVGIGEASASPAAYSMIADYFPKERRATALSIYSSGLYIGGGIAL